MAITGIGSSIAASALAQQNMQNQLDVLSRQLGTGQKAAVYSDLGSQAGITVGLDAQLSAINGYANTNTTVTTTLGIAEGALSQIGDVANTVQQAAAQPAGIHPEQQRADGVAGQRGHAARPDAQPAQHPGGRQLSVLG